MKKIIATFSLICFFCHNVFAVEPFDSIVGTTFQDVKKGMYQEYSITEKDEKVSYADFKSAVQEKWGIFKETRGALWVQYDQDYTSRSIINFVRGTIEIEVLVANTSERAKKEAVQRLQHQFYTAHMLCQEHLNFGLLTGLEGRVEVTTMPNLPKEAFPQLYPVKKPQVEEAPKGKESSSVTPSEAKPSKPKPSVPKSYVEEMRMRKGNPSAFPRVEDKDASGQSLYSEYGLDYKTALSQYVKNGPNIHYKPKVDETTPVHIAVTHIMADISLLSPEILAKPRARDVISIKFSLQEDFLEKARDQYKALVTEYSARFGLVENVVYAIMHTESHFNPFARSYVPAYGLMQLVPSSGGRDGYKYVFNKDIKPSEDYLYDPENNILLGTAYFNKVKEVYFKGIANEQSAYIASVAAYNTGIGNVAKAITGSTNLKNAVAVINTMRPYELYDALQKYLPYVETKGYLNYVLSRSAMYFGQ